MNNIQIDYEGDRVDINLDSIESAIQTILQMAKDFVQWLQDLYHSAVSSEPRLHAV